MKRHLLFALAALGCLAPAAAHAQTQATQSVTLERTAAVQGTPVRSQRVMAPVQARITPDRPYSAEAVSESVQVLADGNRITRRTVTRVYRDAAGRTRRETLADDGSIKTITISDAVAGVSYTLDPATKIARKSAGALVASTVTGTYSLGEMRTTGTSVRAVQGVASGTGSGTGQGTGTGSGSGGGTGGRTARVARGGYVAISPTRVIAGAPNDANVKKEDLQPQNVEGVMANGSRTISTIPAGQIGNAQEIRIVSEQWFSDDLQALVLTKHSDPRTGETTYRLRNILRAEPDPSLFIVPSDYTIQSR